MEHAQYEPRRDDVGLQGNPHEASAKGLVPSVASPDIRHPLHLLRQEIEESVVPLRFQPEDAEPGERQPVLVPVAREAGRSEEHTSELQSLAYLVCRLLLEKKKAT